jgi:3-phosphoshikimate 1-carboxyvinyltransferase
MQISVEKSEVKGSARAPASKSYTIRGLMCAALARGHSELWYPLESDDTAASARVLGQIGVRISSGPEIDGVDGDHFHSPEGEMFCGDSAATLRFMSTICALVPGQCRLTGGPSLMKRPVRTLVEALNRWGIDISCQGETAPINVRGGTFKGGVTELPGDISSQFVSALLLIAPLAEKKATIRLTTPLESKPYALMTIECLRQFGINVRHSDELMEFEVSPQAYRAAHYTIEGDWSSASYLMGLGVVAGELKIENLNLQSWQGDKVILNLIKYMGAAVQISGNSVTVRRNNLKAIKADLTDAIDLLPTVAVLAALAEGESEFTGIQRARLKESNRVKAVKEGLKSTGIRVIEELDRLIIRGGQPAPAVIDAQNDHRIAMAFSLLGVAAGGITIQGAECVSKTYPGYWDMLRSLGVKLNER